VPDKTTLIRSSGVNVDRFAPRPNVAAGDADTAPIVLFAGRLIREKGLMELVEAARRVKRVRPCVRFQIAGDPDPGNPSSLESEVIDAWRAEGVVELLGHQNHIDELIAGAAMVVLPSYREGVPRTLLEASAMGKPCIATDVAGCREAVVNGWNGILVPPKDVDALADAIVKLLDDHLLRARMGRNGRRMVLEEFDERIVIRRTAEIYESMGLLPIPAGLAEAA
jgi:glycosyltransferase involved in cell wall biosynthesis